MVLLTTSLIVWPRRKLRALPARTVAGTKTVAAIVFPHPGRRWKILPPMITPPERTPGKKVPATLNVGNVRVAGVGVAGGAQRAMVQPVRRLTSLPKQSSKTNLSPLTMMDSGQDWPPLAAALNADRSPTAPRPIEDVRIDLLRITATDPHELKKRRQADPINAPAAIGTKARIGPLVPIVGLAMMPIAPQTVPPAGNLPDEMMLVGMNHGESLLAVAATKKSKPHVLIVEVATTDRPAMIVLLVMTAPLVATLPNAAVTKLTPSPHALLQHVPTAVNGMNVPLVATRPSAAATVMPTHHNLPAPTPHVPSKAVAMIGLLAEIAMIALPVEIAMIALPVGTAMTDLPAETVTNGLPVATPPRVRIVGRESLHVAPSQASRLRPAVTGTMRTPTTMTRNRPARSPRRSMPRRGNMPSRC